MSKGLVKTKLNSKSNKSTGGGGSGDMTKIVYDPSNIGARVLFDTQVVDIIEATNIIGTATPVNQQYLILDSNLPADITAVLITTIPTDILNTTVTLDYNNTLMLTVFGWKNGYYNPNTNEFSIKMNQRFMIEDFGGTIAITVIYDDYTGTSYTISVYSAGEAAYEISSGSDNNWVTGSYKSIYRPHPYYNFNNDPCVGYGSVVSTNKIRVQGLNTALGGILDSDGQLPANNLYIDMENTLTNI